MQYLLLFFSSFQTVPVLKGYAMNNPRWGQLNSSAQHTCERFFNHAIRLGASHKPSGKGV